MIQRLILVIAYVLISSMMHAQEAQKSSFGIMSDNDAYVNPYQDQYYSNGLVFTYRSLVPSVSDRLIKKIYVIDFGQSIYMPSQEYKGVAGWHDRPYAGYLFANFSVEHYTRKRSLIKWRIQLGVLGSASKGEFVQEFLHNAFGLAENEGWEYQIQNQLGLNLDFLYLKNVLYAFKRQLDVNVYMDAKAGIIFSQFDMGFVSRIGLKPLNALYNTGLFHSNVNTKEMYSSDNEVFFYIKPQLSYVIYDATISGSLFNSDSPVSFPTIPFQTTLELGLKVSADRFDVSYSVFFLSKRPDNTLAKEHKFGRLELVCRFN